MLRIGTLMVTNGLTRPYHRTVKPTASTVSLIAGGIAGGAAVTIFMHKGRSLLVPKPVKGTQRK